MKKIVAIACALSLIGHPASAADGLLEKFGLGKSSGNAAAPTIAAGLSQEEIAAGLKEALSKGVERAVSMLGREDGFLKDSAVKIPMPENLRKVEKTLRKLHQEKLADEFVTSMNRAAELAVPQAAAVLGDSVKQMSVADAKAILTGTNNAATQYFRRTSETNLFERFLPIVQKATQDVGVTSAYKTMVAKTTRGFGGFGGTLFGLETPDLDAYVTHKALDGLFSKIAEQEKQIRENPAARATDLLQKVFGGITR